MADLKISAQTQLTTVTGDERIPCAEPSGGDYLPRYFLPTTHASAFGRHPGFIAGNWYNPVPAAAVTSGAALANGTIKLLPFMLGQPITISDLGCRITTTNAGNVQLAIYNSVAATKLPGTLAAATGDITAASAAAVSADITGSNVTLAPGLYYMAVNADNAVCALQTINSSAPLASYLIGSATLNDITSAAGASNFYFTFASAFNTWPDLTGQTLGVTSAGGANGLVYLKAA